MADDDTRRNRALDFAAGLQNKDLDRLRSALTPDATWTVPGTTAISGLASGADAVIDRAAAIADSDASIELSHVLLGLDGAALLLHNTGRHGDAVLDEQVVVAFTFEGDLIASATNLISDVPGLDAFFAAGEQGGR